MKKLLRDLLWFLRLDITRNLRYDRLTYRIIKKVLKPTDVCVDVGAHKGEVLDWMLECVPQGKIIAFEPIPALSGKLKEKYTKLVDVQQVALNDSSGFADFQLVKNDPAYSGFRKRSYKTETPEIETLRVKTETLDSFFHQGNYPSLIKIDVEGAELQVLKGCKQIIEHASPVILFEFGLGAADHYGTTPGEMFNLFHSYSFVISTLKAYLNNEKPLDIETFTRFFNQNTEYYFVAYRPK